MEPLEIVNLLRSALGLGTMLARMGSREAPALDVRAVRRIAPAGEAPSGSLPGADAPRVIDDRLLRDLLVEIERAQARYREALRLAPTPEARRAADGWAEREIGDHIRRIRARNAGVLPLDALRDVARSYGSADV